MARGTRRPPARDPVDELRRLAIDLDPTALADALHAVLDRAERGGLSSTAFTLALFGTEAAATNGRRLTDRATIPRFTGRSFRDPAQITGSPLDVRT